MGLPCLNCKKDVEADQAKLFGGVYCCPTCYLIAERLFNRGQTELKGLLDMMRESIRIALVEGRLHLQEGAGEEVSKRDLLEAIVQLQEKSHATDRARSGSGDPADQSVGPRSLPAPLRALGGGGGQR